MTRFVTTQNLISAVSDWVRSDPDFVLFRVMRDASTQTDDITYAELDLRSRRIAAYLSARYDRQSRVILAFGPGIEFVVTFLGCLYAGMVAVPVPIPASRREGLNPFIKVLADCEPVLIAVDAAAERRFETSRDDVPTPIVSVSDLLKSDPVLDLVEPSGDDLVFLQYTSGSTSDPKGVQITHDNLTANLIVTAEMMSVQDPLRGVSWLPHFHDMGLMGGVLQPMYLKIPIYLMAPADFLRDPYQWLKLISDQGLNAFGGPTFTFSLACDRVDDSVVSELDLRQSSMAIVGSEMVRADVLDRFSEKFSPAGFDARAYYPCYGLAEATLIASGGDRYTAPTVIDFDENGCTRRLVSCGGPPPGGDVRIVDSDTGRELLDDAIGEVWIKGPYVSPGYWRKPDLNAQVFDQTLNGVSGYFRTGDLGLIRSGELYVTGRLKEMIVVNGANYYPHDIELVVQDIEPIFEVNTTAVFQCDSESGERFAVVQEVPRHQRDADLDAIGDRIYRGLLSRVGVAPVDICFVREGQLPRTTSGKVQRLKSRHLWESSQFKVMGRFSLMTTPLSASTQSDLGATVLSLVGSLCGMAPESISTDARVSELLDSVSLYRLVQAVEAAQGVRIEHPETLVDLSISELIDAVGNFASGLSSDSELKSDVVASFSNGDDAAFSEADRFDEWIRELHGNGGGRFDDPRVEGQTPETRIAYTEFGEKQALNFSSYNYLGLSTDPRVVAAAKDALDQYGLGANSSPLVGGTMAIHRQLESSIESMFGLPDRGVTLYSSGYGASIGVIPAVVRSGHVVVLDELAHTSLVEGARLSGASIRFFKHNDVTDLDRVLASVQDVSERVLVCTESVFSTDGDFSPIRDIVRVSKQYNALVLVDEAHSILMMGPRGAGYCVAQGVAQDVDFILMTMSKGFGGIGGAVLASAARARYLNWYSKSRMFSCALDPAVTGGMVEGLAIAAGAEGEAKRARLEENAELLRSLLAGHVRLSESRSWILSVYYGDDRLSVPVHQALRMRGIEVSMLQYPAVPKNQARIRLFVTSEHTDVHLRRAAEGIVEVAQELGFAAA